MKKILIGLLFLISALSVSAQIFNTVEQRDKFDDLLKRENVKTLVTFSDTVIIIETKGRKPQKYIILNEAPYNSMGDKDNIVNLVNDTWGYQKCWCVIKDEDRKDYIETCEKIYNKELDENEVQKFWRWITDRVVTTEFSHTFIRRLVWVSEPEGSKVDRYIYYYK